MVGAGYIGVEMAEALINRGYEVTVVNRGKEPMSTLDPDMGRLVHEAMAGLGITMVDDAEVTKVLTGDDGRVRAVATQDAEYPADVVVLGIGVRPETGLAQAAGLPLGAHGGLLTDLAMRVRGHENIWAGGDCVEVLDLVSGRSGTSRWARTPTSTARSSARTWATATPRSRAWSARRSARCATWRSPAPACARRTPTGWA